MSRMTCREREGILGISIISAAPTSDKRVLEWTNVGALRIALGR